MKRYIKEYFLIIGKARSRLPILIFYFIFSSLLDILGLSLVATYIPLIIGDFSFLPDEFVNLYLKLGKDSADAFLYLGFFIVAVYGIKGIISYDIQKRIIKFSLGVELDLRDRLLQAYMEKNYSFFLTENSSNIINNIGIYANTFQTATVTQSLKFFAEALLIGFIIVLLLASNPLFTISVALLLLIFFFLYDFSIKEKILRAGKVASFRFGNVVDFVNQAIFGIKEVKILNKESFFKDKLKKEVILVNNARYLQDSLKLIPRYTIEFILVASTMAMAIIMQYLGTEQTIILSNVAVFVVAGTRLMPSANVLITSLASLRSGRFVVSELAKTLETVNQKSDNPMKSSSDHEKLEWNDSIEFKSIYFRYPDSDKYLFKGIDFRIRKGESIGIIGESGSGKTSLVNILLNLLDFEKGEIIVDGNKINDRKHLIQNTMAYIPQNIFLLDDTVRNNIAFGIEEDCIDDNLIRDAVEKAKLNDLLNSLPKGLDTKIGERGIRFSGGQQQRIAIARAFYSNREILILDEATSALDDATEKEIVREIELLQGKFTMIVIAHRLSTLESCDRIISINQGRLINK